MKLSTPITYLFYISPSFLYIYALLLTFKPYEVHLYDIHHLSLSLLLLSPLLLYIPALGLPYTSPFSHHPSPIPLSILSSSTLFLYNLSKDSVSPFRPSITFPTCLCLLFQGQHVRVAFIIHVSTPYSVYIPTQLPYLFFTYNGKWYPIFILTTPITFPSLLCILSPQQLRQSHPITPSSSPL